MSNIKNVSDLDFDSVISQGQKPIMVDFYAEWCGPCKQMLPTLEFLAEEYVDSASIVKIDIDKSPEVAKRFGVVSIPTLMLFVNGEMKVRLNGGQTRSRLAVLFEQYSGEGA